MKIILLIIGILLVASLVFAGPPVVKITVDNTTGGVPIAYTGHPNWAFCILESAQIRYTFGTPAPTTTTGVVMNPMDSFILDSFTDIDSFRAIRTGSTSGTLTCVIK